MKTIVKIEIVILALVVLVAAGMILISEGALTWFREPVVIEKEVPPIPTEAPAAPVSEEPQDPIEQPKETNPAESRALTAKKYFVYDVREGEYLQKKGEGDEKLYPASITKLLSAYVVLQHMDSDEVVEAGDAMNLVAWDSSVAGIKEGDKLTAEQLVAAMMLPSGNDAAQVAAVAIGRKIGGKELDYQTAAQVFADEMNRQAKAIGMTDSHFVSPDGYHDDDHYTTMNDLVTLCEKVLANETILKYTAMDQLTVELPDRKLTWKNTNTLLHPGHETYHANTIGLKTGFTNKAGNCLITAFFETDRILLVGVFGCPKGTADRYLDTVAIYNSI